MKQTDKQTQNVFIEKYRKNKEKRKFKSNETNRQTDTNAFIGKYRKYEQKRKLKAK